MLNSFEIIRAWSACFIMISIISSWKYDFFRVLNNVRPPYCPQTNEYEKTRMIMKLSTSLLLERCIRWGRTPRRKTGTSTLPISYIYIFFYCLANVPYLDYRIIWDDVAKIAFGSHESRDGWTRHDFRSCTITNALLRSYCTVSTRYHSLKSSLILNNRVLLEMDIFLSNSAAQGKWNPAAY